MMESQVSKLYKVGVYQSSTMTRRSVQETRAWTLQLGLVDDVRAVCAQQFVLISRNATFPLRAERVHEK
jgi:hypothetical protein